MAAQLPLPLVPAMWTKRRASWGRSSRSSSSRTRLRPGRDPIQRVPLIYSNAWDTFMPWCLLACFSETSSLYHSMFPPDLQAECGIRNWNRSDGRCPRRSGTPRGSLSGKRIGKSRIFPQKSVDPGIWLCYTLFYLSDERFLFARFFPRAGSPRRSIQGGNARETRVNKIGGAEKWLQAQE